MRLSPTGLIAAGVMLVLGAAVVLASTASRKPHVRWVRQCDVSLDLTDGSFTAARTLNDDGQRWYDDDRFDWHPKDQIGTKLPMSISWYGSWQNGSWRDGRVQVYLRDDSELPANGRLVLRRPTGIGPGSAFAVTMSNSVGDRHAASAGFRLNDLLTYARSSETLDWTYENPLTRRKIDKSGSVDIAPLRDALNARRGVERKLAAMQADYRNACRRVQDHGPTVVV